MPCQGCSQRAIKLLNRMGWARMTVGPNQRMCFVFENGRAAIVFPYSTVRWNTTKATVLSLVARLLFGKSRASEPPTETEVLDLSDVPEDLVRRYSRRDVDLRIVRTVSGYQLRRAPWLRVIGPVAEKPLADSFAVAARGGTATPSGATRAAALSVHNH